MKLYYAKYAASLAVRIMINEINLSCVYEAVDLKTKLTKTGNNYFKITPKGYVPALKTGKQIITETAVILQYLAEQHQATTLLPEIGNADRYHVLEWLTFIGTELHKNVAALLNPNIPDETKGVLFNTGLKIKLNLVNNHLAQNQCLVGDQFTIPDTYLFTVLFWLPIFLKIELSHWPHLHNYFLKLNDRLSIRKALAEEMVEEVIEVQ